MNQCGIVRVVWELEFIMFNFNIIFVFGVTAVPRIQRPLSSFPMITLWAIPEWIVYIGEVVVNHRLADTQRLPGSDLVYFPQLALA